MGRDSKPGHLKKLQGNPGKRKTKKQTFTATDAKYGLPKGMHQEVRTKCRQMAHFLQEQGLPVDLTRSAFERYCKHLQMSFDAEKVIRKQGVILNGKKHPAAQIFKDNSNAAFQFEQWFVKISKNFQPDTGKGSGLDEYMAGRKKKGA